MAAPREMNFETFFAEAVLRLGLSSDEVEELARRPLDSLERLEILLWFESESLVVDEEEVGSAETLSELHSIYRKAQLQTAAEPIASATTLPGRRYQLQPITDEMLPFLHQLTIDEEVGYRWRYRGAIPTFAQFAEAFWAGTLAQFLATVDNEPIAHVVAYNYDPVQGFVYAGMVSTPKFSGTGHPARVGKIFFEYVFRTWPIRKIYLETPEFNYGQIASGAGTAFDVEGVLKEHDYYDGRFWDRYMLAIYRRHLT